MKPDEPMKRQRGNGHPRSLNKGKIKRHFKGHGLAANQKRRRKKRT